MKEGGMDRVAAEGAKADGVINKGWLTTKLLSTMTKGSPAWMLALGLTIFFVFELFFISSEHLVFAEEELMREQVSADVPVIQAVLVKNGEVSVFVTRQLENGELRDFSAPFQAGSMARVMTSVALLDLLDSKKIDMDSAVKDYLPEELQQEFGALTFKDILLHRTGFVNHRLGTISTSVPDCSVRERAEMMLSKAEQRFPKEQYSLFSNMESALLTVLMEELSGQDYADYMRMYFLSMGMKDSFVIENSLEQSSEEQLGRIIEWEDMMPRYDGQGAQRVSASAYYAKLPAADDFVTTIEDMKRFLLSLSSSRIAREYRVFSPVFTNITSKVARSTVFNHMVYKGESVYIMDAALPGAFERMLFIPDKDISLFLYYNSSNPEVREEITKALLSPYVEDDWGHEPEYVELATETFSGHYSPVNLSQKNVEKFVSFSHQARIHSVEEGLLLGDSIYRPMTATLFYSASDERYLKFITDEDGRLQYLAIDGELYEKSMSSNVELVFLLLLGLLLALLLFGLIRKWRQLIVGRVDDRPRVELLLSTLLSILVVMNALYAVRGTTYWNIAYGGTWFHSVLFYFGWSLVISVGLNISVLIGTKNDYKWHGFFRVLIYATTFLLVFFLFWLMKYRFLFLPF